VSELLFAGFLRKEGIETVKCISNDLEVPADSEIVIEGWVNPLEERVEGPFGDHTGFYSPADAYPVLHVEAITLRKNPVYPATIVGPPPMEDAYLGLATERIFLPVLRWVLPEIVDIHMPPAGAFHNLVIVAIRKAFPGHPQKVMHALWGLGQMMLAKGIVAVDADVDPHDGKAVLFHVCGNVDPRRDVLFSEGPLDALDHASDRFAFGSKLGIDATRKDKPFDTPARPWPKDLRFPEEILERIAHRWKEYGSP
jgi:4-hydroxy-3-polyprenylbenzoate decarboxylase